MLKSKKLLISLISAAFLLLAICVGAINVRAAEGLVLKYDDQEVTEIALTVGQRGESTLHLGGERLVYQPAVGIRVRKNIMKS